MTRRYTPSECAKMGSGVSREVSAQIKENNIKRYMISPKLCKKCNGVIPYEIRRNVFCSQSCAASYNNIGVRRHGNPPRNCLLCGKIIKIRSGGIAFCSISHARIYNANKNISDENKLSSKSMKKYLIETNGRKCENCKLEEWIGKPIPLDVHHIDGNRKNNKLGNLKLLCKNCHGLTDNYAFKKNIENL